MDGLQHAGHGERGAPRLAEEREAHRAIQAHIAVVDPRAERHLQFESSGSRRDGGLPKHQDYFLGTAEDNSEKNGSSAVRTVDLTYRALDLRGSMITVEAINIKKRVPKSCTPSCDKLQHKHHRLTCLRRPMDYTTTFSGKN